MAFFNSRLFLAFFIPFLIFVMGIIAFFVVLFGRSEQRREIERGMSRLLSAEWDGQGDCTFSAWSYRMLVYGKEWGEPRVKFVDFLNNEPGHCQKAYEWHLIHGLLEKDDD